MPAINFQNRFATAILNGEKNQTVRAWRKRAFRAGDMLHLYTGMRGRGGATLLMRRPCARVATVFIDRDLLVLDGEKVDAEGRREFGKADGFSGWADFVLAFEKMHELPCEGQVIYW